MWIQEIRLVSRGYTTLKTVWSISGIFFELSAMVNPIPFVNIAEMCLVPFFICCLMIFFGREIYRPMQLYNYASSRSKHPNFIFPKAKRIWFHPVRYLTSKPGRRQVASRTGDTSWQDSGSSPREAALLRQAWFRLTVCCTLCCEDALPAPHQCASPTKSCGDALFVLFRRCMCLKQRAGVCSNVP